MRTKRIGILKISIIFVLLIFVSSILFLTFQVYKGSFSYAFSQRFPKLIAIFLIGFTISLCTILFQTITNNKLLTPSIIGIDSFYVFTQTVIVYALGTSNVLIVNKKLNFLICLTVMVIVSAFIFSVFLKRGKSNIILIILVGIILGTMFNSFSKFMQIAIDPNEYLILQSRLFASFSNINVEILLISLIMIIVIILLIWKDFKYLDVMSLGRDHSINLGIDYDGLVKKFFIIVILCTAISTALVGPITFLGLIVVNITYEVVKSYKHLNTLSFCILLSIFILVFCQFLLERVLKWEIPISVIINLIGGIYFMCLLLKERY